MCHYESPPWCQTLVPNAGDCQNASSLNSRYWRSGSLVPVRTIWRCRSLHASLVLSLTIAEAAPTISPLKGDRVGVLGDSESQCRRALTAHPERGEPT